MMIEQFLSLRPGNHLFNCVTTEYCQVSSVHFPQNKSITEIVQSALEGKGEDVYVYSEEFVSELTFLNRHARYNKTIRASERDDWNVYPSIVDIPNNKFILKLLMFEIEKLKNTLRISQSVQLTNFTGQQIFLPVTPGFLIPSTNLLK